MSCIKIGPIEELREREWIHESSAIAIKLHSSAADTATVSAAAAGLQDNIIDEHYSIEDPGVLKVGDFTFANWYYTDYGKKSILR